MKLKTAIEYILHISNFGFEVQSITHQNETRAAAFYNVLKYAKFLKQLLQLWMFIPCDKEGKPLEKPDGYDYWLVRTQSKSGADNWDEEYYKRCSEYQQACDRQIFTGFELYQDTYFNSYNCVIRSSDMVIINIENKTVEDLASKVEVTDRVATKFKLK